MSGNSNNKSDLGFVIFLVLAVIVLIPLAIGFDSFASLIRTMKIVLGLVFSLAVIVLGIGGYYFYKRKVKNRNVSKKKKERSEESSEFENDEIEVRKEKAEVIIQNIKKEEMVEQDNQQIDKLALELQEFNKKFDL